MNTYTFHEINVGMTESFSVTITEEMMAFFKQITGDNNPLHNSTEFSVSAGYMGKVVYGMLTASFLSTLAGVYLPGENSLIHSTETKFLRPVYIGDKLKVQGTVVDITGAGVSCITLKTTIFNQYGDKVLKGKMMVGVTK